MAVIFAGGEIQDYQALKKLIPDKSYIICADGGTRHARAMGLIPNLIIGDMDSVQLELLNYYQGKGTVICYYPTEKDEVDTELAIREAVKAGSKEILLLGATGGRLDHTLANVHLLVAAAKLGVRGTIIDEQHRISLVTPQLPGEIKGETGDLVSLIPLTSEVTGVFSTGLKWELVDRSFNIGHPFGISNELTGSTAAITVREGILLMIRVWNKGG
ncbi:thiamine pyrophosphokinase [Desulfohalotomaculum tongense]|uniref:thiamine diphosphokinase n=1 Tax=Desulforadius tongensis TaxID=1216062 RepID=UPI00195C8B8F|nr:thiamine diphosphokinase [Desulforadius tongensis]MBM7855544.1 thiamine pyrophosphokinase [Desulforadius tongensis]